MVRLLLLLLIAGGLIVFTVQNLSPIAIVVLGLKTQALPLAVWVLGAIAAGGLTTVLLSGFSSLSKNAAVRRSTRRTEPEPARSSWSGAPPQNAQPPRRNATGFSASRADDDWETPVRDDWDEWGQEPARRPASDTSSASSTRVRDTADDDWKDWSSYENTRRSSARSTSSRTPRSDFEARQKPASTQRTGSVYSYSYREPQDISEPRAERKADRATDKISDKTSEVYDAEYRVLIPPFNADVPPVPPPEPPPSASPAPPPAPAKAEDDDDWGDLFDDLDSSKR